jgi:hypothetical protein
VDERGGEMMNMGRKKDIFAAKGARVGECGWKTAFFTNCLQFSEIHMI